MTDEFSPEENIESPKETSQEKVSISEEERLKNELQECKDKYLRLLAESENTRKRLQKEKIEMMRFSVENVISEFLLPMDNLESALSFTSQMSEETANWAKGFTMILGQFKDVLANNGITTFQTLGTSFDPHLHEAVEIEETESRADGEIIQEYSKGYKSETRAIRPARVKVAKKPTLKTENKENN